ncbi:MAG: hypothetical protein KBT09_00290 [Bacteroidales bacterium]|nr:hypothetical protein [Candidatus Sodaliphilus fimicaballi]
MKKNLLLLVAMFWLAVVLPACSSSADEPDMGNHEKENTLLMQTYVSDLSSKDAASVVVKANRVKVNIETGKANLVLDPGIDALNGEAIYLKDIQLEKNTDCYSYVAEQSPNARVTNVRIDVDFDLGQMFIGYTVDGKYRVTSVPQMFMYEYCSNVTSINYMDGQSSTDEMTNYIVDVDTKSMTAKAYLYGVDNTVNNADGLIEFFVIIKGLKVEPVSEGYVLTAEKAKVESNCIICDGNNKYSIIDTEDKDGHQKWPISNFKSVINIAKASHNTSFTMGSEAENTIPFVVNVYGMSYRGLNQPC